MKKKTRIILAILAVVMVFCLWYTRPRSFEELAGDGNITSVSIIAGTALPEIETARLILMPG